ncbi:MAG TPA: response regulator [Elusimicrobiales bacterium]|nr:response regulator [Elusimicrobiales bacterium]HOL62198.1 response regulator [Elusimicrobiales bacterium]HPO95203.1 response regulator [Elusimicrobiales bacterium]
MEKKRKILVAEDDSDMMEQMNIYLESNDYRVLKAYTQEEAEKIIDSGDFDAAVLDLMLENPDSGFILSHKIKKNFPDKPVIIVTSVAKETGVYFDKNADSNNWIKADAIIQKELRFEQLKKELENLFSRSK